MKTVQTLKQNSLCSWSPCHNGVGEMHVVQPVRTIDARTGKISWNWTRVEPAHISYLLSKGEVLLNALTTTKAASVVEYIATRESIRKAANVCRTLSDEEIEILTNYAALNADESSYLRVLTFMLKEGLYDNCVLYLPMTRNLRAGINDTDTEVYDRSPFGNHGTIHGAVWQTLPSGKSVLSFDGVDDYVEVPDSASLDVTDEITVMAWVKVNSFNELYQNWIISRGTSYYSAEVGDGYYIRLWDSGKVQFLIGDGGTSYHDLISPEGIISTGNWYHIVGVFTGNQLKLYVNLQDFSSDTFSGYGLGNGTSLQIPVNKPGYQINGTIDEVRIYNRALSGEEIKRLFNLTRVFYGV